MELINRGDKAIALRGLHVFEIGSEIEFVEMADFHGLPVFVFSGTRRGIKTTQKLLPKEFRLIEE